MSRPRSSSSWLRRNCTHCALGGRFARLLERPHERLDVAGRQRVEQPLVDREVQHHLQPVAFVAEVLHALVRRDVGFGQHDRIARRHCRKSRISFSKLKSCLAARRRPLLLDQERHGVHAEAGHAELQPEPHDLLDLGAHVRVPRVQVGLVVVEAMEVVLPRLRRPSVQVVVCSPGKDDALVVVRPAARPTRRTSRGNGESGSLARLLKPRRIDRRVVDDEIDDDADAERVGVIHELDEVAERAVLVVDAVVVGDVVAVVAIGRRVERLQPDAGDAEARQVVEPALSPSKSPMPSPFAS